MDSSDLERRVDGALKALPAPAAPRTLLPRVMAAVAHARPAPWYSRAWLTWPRPAQAASIALLAVVGAAAWWTMPALAEWTGSLTASFSPLTARLRPETTWIRDGLVVGRVVWDIVLQPLALVLVALAVAVSFLTTAYWSVITRLVPGGTFQ